MRRLLYELFEEHGRKKTVARILNERGHRTRNGSAFSDTTVDRLIRDPTAKGLHRANYTRTDDRSKNWSLKPEDEWVYTPVEAIVSEELWERANGILDTRRASLKRTNPQGHPPLRRLRLLPLRREDVRVEQQPQVRMPRMPQQDTGERPRSGIPRTAPRLPALSPNSSRSTTRTRTTRSPSAKKLIASMEAELKKLNSEDERLYQLYLSGNLSPEDFGRRQRPISGRRAQLEDELPRQQAQLDVIRVGIASRAETLDEARDLWANWENLSREDKRSVIEAITDRIVHWEGRRGDLPASPSGRACRPGR